MKRKVALFISILLIAIISNYNGFSQIKKMEKIPDTATKVLTGIYIMNIYDMDMSANSFFCDFYIWFRWKGDIDPTVGLEFVNYVDKWGYTLTPLEDSMRILSDGSKYKSMRVESRFYHSFDLKRYPLDEQILDIQVENSEFELDKLVYVPDTVSSKIRAELQVTGWDLVGLTIDKNENNYNSNFGIIDENSKPYSNLSFEVKIQRPINYFLFKLMLPLVLVIMSAIGAMILFGGHVDARLSLPIGSLLTAVFLQQSYTSSLPEIGYMVLMDKIYALSYVVILCSLIEAIITANWVSKEDDESYARARKLDLQVMIPLFFIYLIGVIVIVFTT